MNITKVQIHVLKEKNKTVVGYADIIIDGEFIVRSIVIRENDKNETYVTMPCQIHNDIRRDIAHPITEPCRVYVENTILDEYELVLNRMASAREARENHQVTPT